MLVLNFNAATTTPIVQLNLVKADSYEDIAIGAGDLGFKPRSGQKIRHHVANDLPPLRRFFGAVFPRCKAAEMGSTTCCMLRRNIASIIKT